MRVKLLLKHGADVDHIDNVHTHYTPFPSLSLTLHTFFKKDGATALMRAARYGHVDVVELLINAGADLELQETESGMTALITAVKWNRCLVVKLLLESKVNINLQDKVCNIHPCIFFSIHVSQIPMKLCGPLAWQNCFGLRSG